MKKYEIKGGGTIEAASDFELVEKLKISSFTESGSQQEFMDDMARRCLIQTGAAIRTNNPVVFIHDLLEAKFLKVVSPE